MENHATSYNSWYANHNLYLLPLEYKSAFYHLRNLLLSVTVILSNRNWKENFQHFPPRMENDPVPEKLCSVENNTCWIKSRNAVTLNVTYKHQNCLEKRGDVYMILWHGSWQARKVEPEETAVASE
jgi:hypothetical protein